MSFEYKNNLLYCEDISLDHVAKNVGTPCYVYSKSQFTHNFQVLYSLLKQNLAVQNRNFEIAFSVKSCPNINILKHLKSLGSSCDCVSIGEVMRAIKAGFNPQNVVFAGIGKTKHELYEASKLGIKQINTESLSEITLINQIGAELNTKINIAIRLNPNINANTHSKITTGTHDSKFGIDAHWVANNITQIQSFKNINLIGFSIHIGSQITDIAPLISSFEEIVDITTLYINAGFDIQTIDFGGGLGVQYSGNEKLIKPDIYIASVSESAKKLPANISLIIEPGRFISCTSGILVSSILHLKQTAAVHFAITDAGMNDLMRPAIYDAYHKIIPVTKRNNIAKYDIVGPICESSCIFGKDREIAELQQNDLIAILNAGAYGASMSNNYNSRLLVPEVLVDNDKFTLIRKPQTYEQLFELENI